MYGLCSKWVLRWVLCCAGMRPVTESCRISIAEQLEAFQQSDATGAVLDSCWGYLLAVVAVAEGGAFFLSSLQGVMAALPPTT